MSRVESHFETSCVLSGEIQWSHDIPWIDFCYHVPIIFVIDIFVTDISQCDVASGHPRSTIYTVAPPGRMVNGWQVGNPNSSFHCWILVRSDCFHVEIQLVTKGSATMEPSSVAMQRTLTILNITSSCLMKRIILFITLIAGDKKGCVSYGTLHTFAIWDTMSIGFAIPKVIQTTFMNLCLFWCMMR